MSQWAFISHIPWLPVFARAVVVFLIAGASISIERLVDLQRGTMTLVLRANLFAANVAT